MSAKIRSILVFSALTAGLHASTAGAAALSDADRPAVPARAAAGVLLAQAGEVDVYYDEFGRRVVIDAYTGEVLSVERPRRAERRLLRRETRRAVDEERYYLDDPEDMARLRRERMREFGVEEVPGEIDGFRVYDGRDYPDAPAGGYDRPERRYGLEQFPEAPRDVFREEPRAPEVVTRQPVQRAPLAAKPEDTPALAPEVAANDPALATDPETTGTPTIVEEIVEPPLKFTAREDVAALQILLDRRGASPGVIDGKFGSNVDKAIVAYRAITGENLKSTDAEGIKAGLAASGGDPFTTYTITAEDAAGPYVASVPADYGEKAKLERLSYTSVPEALAERFHMDEAYLKALNPEANFNRPGTIIRIANTGQAVTTKVTRVVADKGKKQVRGYDAGGRLVVAYPATIGSADTPSPTGVHAVSRIALNPEYTYNPSLNFKQGNNDKILTIPPGPNGPVGSVWIALDKPTYGVHGTPDPSKIGKTESHGCVRLTNFDAQELAKLVAPGVPVEFVE